MSETVGLGHCTWLVGMCSAWDLWKETSHNIFCSKTVLLYNSYFIIHTNITFIILAEFPFNLIFGYNCITFNFVMLHVHAFYWNCWAFHETMLLNAHVITTKVTLIVRIVMLEYRRVTLFVRWLYHAGGCRLRLYCIRATIRVVFDFFNW